MLVSLETLISAAVQRAQDREPRDKVLPGTARLEKLLLLHLLSELTVHILGNDLGWDMRLQYKVVHEPKPCESQSNFLSSQAQRQLPGQVVIRALLLICVNTWSISWHILFLASNICLFHFNFGRTLEGK